MQAADRLTALLNSRGVGFEAGVDLLATPKTALPILRLFQPDLKSADKGKVKQLRDLREVVLRMVASVSDHEARKTLDQAAASARFVLSFAEPEAGAWVQVTGDRVVGEVLRDCAELMNTGRWNRLKICADEACAAAFYDSTRSGTQRWHSYAVCGNKNNVAAYRTRQS